MYSIEVKYDRNIEIFDSNNITMQKALEKALEKVYANELPLHNWGSFPNVKTIYNYRANMSKLQGKAKKNISQQHQSIQHKLIVIHGSKISILF